MRPINLLLAFVASCASIVAQTGGADSFFPSTLLEASPYILPSEEPKMYGYYLQKLSEGYAIRDGISRDFNGQSLFNKVEKRSNLYRSLRKTSFETKSDWYSATITGLDIWQSSQMAERVANEYGIKGFNSWEDTHYNSYVGTQAFKDNFDKNSNPIIFATSTGVYGSHQIAVFGYRFYRLNKKSVVVRRDGVEMYFRRFRWLERGQTLL